MNIVNKFKYLFIIIPIILLVAAVLLINKISIKSFKTIDYEIKYDSTWKIKDEKDFISLNHKDGEIKINTIDLKDEYKYAEIDLIIDELITNFKKDNEGYNLIAKEKLNVTKYSYQGYKMFYENEKEQVLNTVIKSSDKLYIITYIASNKSFDILLDSVNNIINEFKIINKDMALINSIKIESQKINWLENEEISDDKYSIETNEIASSNYKVKYQFPTIFLPSDINSKQMYYNAKLTNGSMIMSVNVRKQNLFQYLNKSERSSLYGNFNLMREGKSGYIDFLEGIEKIVDKKSYIYKNSYTNQSSNKEYKYENVYLIYELDKNHIAIFEIKATNTTIPEEITKKIKLEEYSNYANYLNSEISNDKVKSILSEYLTYKNDTIRKITLSINKVYNEFDKNENVYTSRYYGKNYNEDDDLYEVEVNYKIGTTIKTNLEIIDSSNKIYNNKRVYQPLAFKEEKTVNDKKIKVYETNYYDKTSSANPIKETREYMVNNKVVFIEFEDSKCLSINIKGNGVLITDEVINDLVNLKIENVN